MISAFFFALGVWFGWKAGNLLTKSWNWVKAQMNNVSE